MMAGGGTAAIFFAMATLATVVKRDLSGLQKFLFIGAVIAMIAGIANVFLQSTGVHLALLVAVLGIFSAFLLVDVKRVIDGGETNYISATLNIYLDLYNVFTALLQLLASSAAIATDHTLARRRSRRRHQNERGPSDPFLLSGAATRCGHPRLSARTPRCSRRAPCAGTVDRARIRAAIARHVDEQTRVARQRGRVAGHVDDALGRRPAAAPTTDPAPDPPAPWPARTRPRAADPPASGPTRRPRPAVAASSRRDCARRTRPCDRARCAGVLARALQPGSRCPRCPAPRGPASPAQREVAQPAEPVDDALTGLHVQQSQRAADQHRVDVVIDLREVGRLERHHDAELGQRVGQLGAVGIEQMHRLRPLGLQPPLHAVLDGERPQLVDVTSAQRLQMTQHQRDHFLAVGRCRWPVRSAADDRAPPSSRPARASASAWR
ncbi:inhibitor of apoptosis-promoting bax1 domain-containing protein [Ditylenchus destructor]|nr:inhibitor of apoptosis-promoting bax1 domain-containing protein [Ditylenchus destructor]